MPEYWATLCSIIHNCCGKHQCVELMGEIHFVHILVQFLYFHSDVSEEAVLKLFGEYFFSFCKMSGYDRMLRTLGGNLMEFIENLDALHSYLSLSYQVPVSFYSLYLSAPTQRSMCQVMFFTSLIRQHAQASTTLPHPLSSMLYVRKSECQISFFIPM